MDIKTEILTYVGEGIKSKLQGITLDFFGELEEIRLRVGKQILLYSKRHEYTLTPAGNLDEVVKNGYIVNQKDLDQTLEMMSGYSLYALTEEIRNGYLTLPGGHRVGVSGQAVVDNGKVRTLKNITGMNIRISHQVKGCGEKVWDFLARAHWGHTMIISPPGCGKTTLLRDMVRCASNGIDGVIKARTVGVVDERSEIAGCYRGVPQNDIGMRTDVLDGCPKAEGMRMLLRAMSPEIIAVDEIGGREDSGAIEEIINGGIVLLCTVHGYSIEDIENKPFLKDLLKQDIFQHYILLQGGAKPGQIRGIYDKQRNSLNWTGR